MTPLLRFLRNGAEKLFGRFYEGPEPPEWLAKMVSQFERTYPKATKRQWRELAIGMAAAGYKAGYVQGYERSERDPNEQALPETPPELTADVMDPNWRQAPIFDPELDNPLDDGSDELEPAELDPERPERNIGGPERIVEHWKREVRHPQGDDS